MKVIIYSLVIVCRNCLLRQPVNKHLVEQKESRIVLFPMDVRRSPKPVNWIGLRNSSELGLKEAFVFQANNQK